MLAGISRRACTTFFLLLCQCPWIVDSLQGPYEVPGSCCSAVCGLQLYLIAEDISRKPHSLWPGIQKEIGLLGGDFLCLPSKNHFFFPFDNMYPNYFPKQLKLLLLFVLKWLIENVLTENQWAGIAVAHIKMIHDDKSHSSANYILLHVCQYFYILVSLCF